MNYDVRVVEEKMCILWWETCSSCFGAAIFGSLLPFLSSNYSMNLILSWHDNRDRVGVLLGVQMGIVCQLKEDDELGIQELQCS